MEIIFDYYPMRDWPTPTRRKVINTQLMGAALVVIGVATFLPEGLNTRWSQKIIGTLMIVHGLYQISFPLKALRPIFIRNHFIRINGQKISWKMANFKKPVDLKFDDMEELNVYNGAISFKDIHGEIFWLKTHKITNKEKLDELYEVMGRLNDRIKKI